MAKIKKKCLIVDDDADSAFIGEHIMRSLGYETHVAEDGREASLLCSIIFPEIIILDWSMPGMDGMAFLDALKTIPTETPPSVIMCTGENQASKVKQALDKGAKGYIVKPYRRADIIRQLKALNLMDE